jgi:hypothetical protein
MVFLITGKLNLFGVAVISISQTDINGQASYYTWILEICPKIEAHTLTFADLFAYLVQAFS